MVLERSQQTTIAISRRNHLKLCALCKKGQSFDQILTQVLKKSKESKENSVEQSKFGIRDPDTLTARLSSTQTTTESDSNYEQY